MQDGVDSYTCDCEGTGYEGVHCEDDIDECATGQHGCMNNATCMVGASHI